MSAEQSPTMNNEAPSKPDLGETVYRLARAIARLDSGSAAALRRGPLIGNGAAAFWKLLSRYEVKGEQRWAAVIQAIAILTPKGSDPKKQSAHLSERSMGATLQEAKVSDIRLARLLNTPGEMRGEAVIRLCRRLAAKGNCQFDLRTLAYFILSNNDKTGRRIAREYYSAEAKAQRTA